MGRYESPEAAYYAFLETFNARDADGWAGVNSWPHARVSAAAPDTSVHWRPPTRTFANAEQYLSAPLWDELEATGWARSQSLEPRIVQSSPTTAHIAGGWTRYRADDTPIASNRIVYVATRTAEGWGLQAQLKLDSFSEGVDFAAEEQAALAAIDRTMNALAAADVDAWTATFHYPLIILFGPGEVQVIEDAAEMSERHGAWCAEALPISHESQIVQAGASGATVAQVLTRGDFSFEQLFLVALREGQWKPIAVSALM